MVWARQPLPAAESPHERADATNSSSLSWAPERACGMYKVLERKWRRKQEALLESFVQPHGCKSKLKKDTQEREQKKGLQKL